MITAVFVFQQYLEVPIGTGGLADYDWPTVVRVHTSPSQASIPSSIWILAKVYFAQKL